MGGKNEKKKRKPKLKWEASKSVTAAPLLWRTMWDSYLVWQMRKEIDWLWIIYDNARNNELKLQKKGEFANNKDLKTGKKNAWRMWLNIHWKGGETVRKKLDKYLSAMVVNDLQYPFKSFSNPIHFMKSQLRLFCTIYNLLLLRTPFHVFFQNVFCPHGHH